MSTEQEVTRRTSSTLHRPADDIADRPQLKVKPLARQDAPEVADEVADESAEAEARAMAATIIVEAPEPAVDTAPEAPSEAEPEPEPESDQPAADESPRKVSKLPRIDPNRAATPYATHGPAPADAAAERAQLAAVTGRKAKDREISTGFLLGIALIVLVLIGGVVIVRLEKRVQRLESRVSLLEQGHAQTASAAFVK